MSESETGERARAHTHTLVRISVSRVLPRTQTIKEAPVGSRVVWVSLMFKFVFLVQNFF